MELYVGIPRIALGMTIFSLSRLEAGIRGNQKNINVSMDGSLDIRDFKKLSTCNGCTYLIK